MKESSSRRGFDALEARGPLITRDSTEILRLWCVGRWKTNSFWVSPRPPVVCDSASQNELPRATMLGS